MLSIVPPLPRVIAGLHYILKVTFTGWADRHCNGGSPFSGEQYDDPVVIQCPVHLDFVPVAAGAGDVFRREIDHQEISQKQQYWGEIICKQSSHDTSFSEPPLGPSTHTITFPLGGGRAAVLATLIT